MTLIAGARASPLSQAQVKEVELLLNLSFQKLFLSTTGDRNQTQSLRVLDKTDFFTRELDQALLNKACDFCIHSAKDLPDPLPSGIEVVALTRGKDPSDALVLQEGETLDSLKKGACIATSSDRREEVVRTLRNDLTFCDLRGTIAERLAKLEKGEVDGVVIAEAALIRLGLTHLNRLILPGRAADYQGQLAITARTGDSKMAALFAPIDQRKRQLWLGLSPPRSSLERRILHRPLIEIAPLPFSNPAIRAAFAQFERYTHIILTSKTAAEQLAKALATFSIPRSALKQVIAVGPATAKSAQAIGAKKVLVAENRTSEGVIELLERLDLAKAFLFWPHSALSRPLISDWLEKKGLHFHTCPLYDTKKIRPTAPIDFESVEEIVFTSPSTVEAFWHFFKEPSTKQTLLAIGPVTGEKLVEKGRDFAYCGSTP